MSVVMRLLTPFTVFHSCARERMARVRRECKAGVRLPASVRLGGRLGGTRCMRVDTREGGVLEKTRHTNAGGTQTTGSKVRQCDCACPSLPQRGRQARGAASAAPLYYSRLRGRGPSTQGWGSL